MDWPLKTDGSWFPPFILYSPSFLKELSVRFSPSTIFYRFVHSLGTVFLMPMIGTSSFLFPDKISLSTPDV